MQSRVTGYRGYREFVNRYDEVNKMLYGMINKADKFC